MKPPKIPNQGSEVSLLRVFLNYQRAVLIDKASGLTDLQLHTRLAPSTLTLGGLINHMALVEDDWFTSDFNGDDLPDVWANGPWDDDRDWEFTNASQVPTEELFERYTSAIARSEAILDAVSDLDQVSVKSNRDGEQWSMLWILIHMIEETARHNGHADLIRESIDGSVGDFPQ
jgi:uncharacterized damage-inducible protein DinB